MDFRKRSSWNAWGPVSTMQTLGAVCAVAALSYLAPKLEGGLILHPRTVWPLWPDCALLVSLLLLVRKRTWLVLVPAAFAGFVLYDLQAGVPLRSIAWFIPADTVEVFIAALCLRHFFTGLPQLNSLRNLTKYLLFAAVLAPFVSAFLSAPGIGGHYWDGWKTCFFSEVLAFVIVTPAVLSWAAGGRAWQRQSFLYHLEGAALITGLAIFSYLSLAAFAKSSSPALLYSLLPFLLWSALRFGSMGISSAVIVVGFVSIWGAVHNRGPFAEAGELGTGFSMQLFLIFTAIPFMILAALAEERNGTEKALRKSEERLRLAVQAGRMYAFEWDAATDDIVRSGSNQVLGTNGSLFATGQQIFNKVHPDDQRTLAAAVAGLSPEKPSLQISHRMLTADGGVIWVERNSRAYFDERGKLSRIIGTVADVTGRKKAEEALHQREEELLQAQRVAQVGSWQWDAKTGVVTWSKELYRIAGHDHNLPPPAYEQQQQLYSPESWERLQKAVAEALHNGTPYLLDLEMIRPDGSTRWITDRGEVVRDAQNSIAWLRGTAQDITERKQAEEALRVSEEKFRTVFRNAAIGMVIISLDGHFLSANEGFCECLGYSEEELLVETVESVTLAEDWPEFSARLREALERGTSFQRVEKRCLTKSGRVVTMESSASLIRSVSGEPRYFVEEVLDITQRKMAEEALASVSRRLIEAHEAERALVARELHDDINQRVALLAVNLRRLKHGLPASAVDACEAIEKASSSVSDLGKEIQALSHRLHSSKLEYLGLVAACEGFCKELSEGQDVSINFHSDDIPNKLPREIALCIFRVLQESLQNAIKHSGAGRFEVSLKGACNEIQLSVHDWGVGFDPEEAVRGRGLGLTSMKERLKLVEGELFVDSQPLRGTMIQARVPFDRRVMSTAGSG